MSSQLKWFLVFVFTITIVTYFVIHDMPDRVDTIFINGRIHTMDSQMTVAEAFAVSGERVVGIGSHDFIARKYLAKDTVNLNGKNIIPGLIDAHCHLLGLGLAQLTVDLVGVQSENEAVERVEKRVAQVFSGQWIRGRGWDQNEWSTKSFPNQGLLNRISNPVYLTRIDGHACWVNEQAMRLAGVTKQTPDPVGGKIVRNTRGEPSGIFIDAAMDLIYRIVPEPTEEEMRSAIKIAIQKCLSVGLTSIHEMGVDLTQVELYKKLIQENAFNFRLYASVDGPGELWEQSKKAGKIIGYGQNRLTIRSLKLYIDGALGSRGAALIDPYSDEPTNRGLTVISEENLQNIVDEALENDFQVCAHAIGDRANYIILNAYQKAQEKNPKSNRRLRVEHAQVLSKDDIPRFHQLGVLPSMQPTHCTSDMYWAEARLGSQRIRGAYAWQSLLKTGVIIPGGSDFPVEDPNPFLGIYAACSRRDLQGRPSKESDIDEFFQLSPDGTTDRNNLINGWYPSECMTREEAVRCFTIWAAYAAFEEDIKGSLERGKLADFLVITKDVFQCPIDEIPDIEVEHTYLGGKKVYTNPHFQQTMLSLK
jgi:predicted amidohydrolase YtcJ